MCPFVLLCSICRALQKWIDFNSLTFSTLSLHDRFTMIVAKLLFDRRMVYITGKMITFYVNLTDYVTVNALFNILIDFEKLHIFKLGYISVRNRIVRLWLIKYQLVTLIIPFLLNFWKWYWYKLVIPKYWRVSKLRRMSKLLEDMTSFGREGTLCALLKN